MRFKHTLHVFVDNFNVTYKQLLFRLIVLLVSTAICIAGIYPFIKDLISSDQFNSLTDGLKGFITNLLQGHVEVLSEFSQKVQKAYGELITLLNTKLTQAVLSGLLLLVVYIAAKWFEGLCNYATACIINDKMALRAEQPFLITLIRNLKEAAIYNLMYVPLSILYDIAVGAVMFILLFYLLNSILYFFISVFLFILALTAAIVVKMSFTTDWLPALIRGKKGQLGSFTYSFSRKNKDTLSIMSNFVVITLAVFALNTAALFLTFGVGLLVTIPASYVIIISFEFVNYYDREGIKYFIDNNTIVGKNRDKAPTREEFFRGDSED